MTDILPKVSSAQTGLGADARYAVDQVRAKIEGMIHKHFTALSKNEAAYTLFMREVDYTPEALDLDLMSKRVTDTLDMLDAQIPQDMTEEQLIRMCRNFVQTEIGRLFFCTNDIVSERIIADGFHDFIEAMCDPKLELPEETRKALFHIDHYLQAGIRSYDHYRQMILQESGNEITSPIAWVHSFSPNYEIAADGAEYATADSTLIQAGIKAFQEVMEGRGWSRPDPAVFLLQCLVDKIAQEQVLIEAGGPVDLDQPHIRQKLTMRSDALLEPYLRAYEALLKAEPKGRSFPPAAESWLADTVAALDQELKTLRNLPDDMPGLLETCMKNAEKQAKVALTSAKNVPGAKVNSAWLKESLAMGTRHRAEYQWGEIKPLLREMLADCESMAHIQEVVNGLVETIGRQLITNGIEPATADAFAAYLSGFGDALSRRIDTKTPSNRIGISVIKQAEDVFRLSRKGAEVARDWLRMDTGGAWDSFYAKGMLYQSAETGKSIAEFSREDTLLASELAWVFFTECCKERGITPDAKIAVVTPALYEQAFATAELAQRSRGKIGNDAERGFARRLLDDKPITRVPEILAMPDDKAIHGAAIKLLLDAINALPRDRNLRGKPIKPHLQSVESQAKAAENLGMRLDCEQQKGRLH